MHLHTTPHIQILNIGWPTEDPDYRPHCTACGWTWIPTEDDDPIPTRHAAAALARATHLDCGTWPDLPIPAIPLAA